jgi:hypothetical protein
MGIIALKEWPRRRLLQGRARAANSPCHGAGAGSYRSDRDFSGEADRPGRHAIREPALQECVPRAREARVIWTPEMPRNQKAASLSIGGHLAMGMTLGAVFALVLLFGSDPSILRMILDASSPALVLALYIGVFAMTFGLGATLTGIMLEAADEQ